MKQSETDVLLDHAAELPLARRDDSVGDDDGAHLLDFFVSGWHMLVRSLLLQA